MSPGDIAALPAAITVALVWGDELAAVGFAAGEWLGKHIVRLISGERRD